MEDTWRAEAPVLLHLVGGFIISVVSFLHIFKLKRGIFKLEVSLKDGGF